MIRAGYGINFDPIPFSRPLRGWYPLVRPEPTTFTEGEGPALREFGMSATCFLRVARPGAHIVQLHVAQRPKDTEPRELSVTCNGRFASRVLVGMDRERWQTVHFPVTLDSETVALELRVEHPLRGETSEARLDYGLQVNEISVLRDDSPMLRPATAAAG